MDLIKLDLNDLSSVKCEFYKTDMPFNQRSEVLVVKFIGECGFGSQSNDDAVYMSAMIAAGFMAWHPFGLILDLSELKYEWGDMMDRVISPPYHLIGSCEDDIYPFALIISDINRKGLTSLIKEEMMEEPKDFLFETLDEALIRVDEMAKEYYKI